MPQNGVPITKEGVPIEHSYNPEENAYNEVVLIGKDTDYEEAVFLSGAYLSNAIDVREYSRGILLIPDAWTASDISFYEGEVLTGTYAQMRKEDASTPYIDYLTGSWYMIPEEIMEVANFIKLYSTYAQEDVRVIKILLKA